MNVVPKIYFDLSDLKFVLKPKKKMEYICVDHIYKWVFAGQ
jgi:hypothetical protein